MLGTLKRHPGAVLLSIALHLLVIGLALLEFSGQSVRPVVSKQGAVDKTIKAEIIDLKKLDKREQKIKKQKADKKKKEVEKKRLEQAAKKRKAELKKKKAEAEKKRKAEAVKKKKAAEAKAKAETKRKVEAEKKLKAEKEAKRKAEEAERVKEEARKKAEAEKRKQQEEAEKAQEEARLKEQAEQRRKEAELNAQLADEERQRELNVKRNKYYSMIQQKISRNWRQPANAGNKPLCEVKVVQGPGGIILDVTFGSCPGTREYRLSVEAAVLKSDPLPEPEDKALFERNIILKFKPNE